MHTRHARHEIIRVNCKVLCSLKSVPVYKRNLTYHFKQIDVYYLLLYFIIRLIFNYQIGICFFCRSRNDWWSTVTRKKFDDHVIHILFPSLQSLGHGFFCFPSSNSKRTILNTTKSCKSATNSWKLRKLQLN